MFGAIEQAEAAGMTGTPLIVVFHDLSVNCVLVFEGETLHNFVKVELCVLVEAILLIVFRGVRSVEL